jgi:hypothetical protein
MDPMAGKRERPTGQQKGEALRPPHVGARTGAEKLDIMTRAEGLQGEELGQFLRSEGVHLTELEQWRELALRALQGEPKRLPPSREVRKLKAELARKEKALAEAAVLLVLKKKAEAIWGDEDDDTEEPSDT